LHQRLQDNDTGWPLQQANANRFLPIPSRNPVDFDHLELSHKRQQGCISKSAIRVRESACYVPLATSVALRTSDASRSDNGLGVAETPKQLSPARDHRVRSSVANCAKCRSAVDENQSSVEGCERVAAILLREAARAENRTAVQGPEGSACSRARLESAKGSLSCIRLVASCSAWYR
jgi:hypothetical protein